MKSATFTDFDAFSESVSEVEAVMTLRNLRHRTWVIHQVQLPGIHVQLGRLGSGNIVEGQSWAGGHVLYLPLTSTCRYTGHGEEIGAGSFLILEPDCDFSVCTADQHDWCTVFVPDDVLSRYGMVGNPSSNPGRCWVSDARPDLANQFRAAVSELIRAALENPNLETSPAAPVAEKALATIASSVLQGPKAMPDSPGGRPKIPRKEIIRRCNAYLEESRNAHASVPDLAAAARVSERTLREAYQAFYGVSPTRYLQLRQLNLVYRDLREGSGHGSTVSGILLKHGIWEHGRFSKRYYETFGEKPSVTLRNA
jgi:AraC-like DNA-binding protein